MESSLLCERLTQLRQRIATAARSAGRDPDAVGLLAVSKTHPADAVAALAACGQSAFGENYVQEGVAKIAALRPRLPQLVWHFIGPLQSNKTRLVAEQFDWVHAIDRVEIARRLSAQRPLQRDGLALPPLQVCLQVNVSGEASKSGVDAAQLSDLARAVAALPHLQLRGLMCIPAPCDDPEQQRVPFARLAALRDALQDELGLPLDTLSMGMSGDLDAAVLEGATLVRVGSALFGARSYPAR